jgi:hypothetical protein
MDSKTLAAALNGQPYPLRLSKQLAADAKSERLVVVFGQSDDLMAFAGAIDDELGAYNGGTAYLTSEGLLRRECDDDRCPYFEKLQKLAATVEARWCKEASYNWTFRTDIPHETFEVLDDGVAQCRGIVFSLADVRP